MNEKWLCRANGNLLSLQDLHEITGLTITSPTFRNLSPCIVGGHLLYLSIFPRSAYRRPTHLLEPARRQSREATSDHFTTPQLIRARARAPRSHRLAQILRLIFG